MRDSISFQQMNEWQQEAILRTKGPLLVTAGPGSGKTRVITYRVLNLLEYEQVSPQRIYVITFKIMDGSLQNMLLTEIIASKNIPKKKVCIIIVTRIVNLKSNQQL